MVRRHARVPMKSGEGGGRRLAAAHPPLGPRTPVTRPTFTPSALQPHSNQPPPPLAAASREGTLSSPRDTENEGVEVEERAEVDEMQ